MPDSMSRETELGLTDLVKRINRAEIDIIKHSRPWPDRRVTYLVLGKSERNTDIVISDQFPDDLPHTSAHQQAVEDYASALAGKVKCGSPKLFYCLSGIAIHVEIKWPIELSVVGSVYSSWLRVDVTDQSNCAIAFCAVPTDRFSAWPNRAIVFDQIRLIINSLRSAIDQKAVIFYGFDVHPQSYQQLRPESHRSPTSHSEPEIEHFLAGKAYMLGFRVSDLPGEVWVTDPWDAEYLGTSTKELARSAYILKAQGLLLLDASQSYARPTDKLIRNGGPAAISSVRTAKHGQGASLADLPKKEELIEDATDLLKRPSGLAMLVIDLDHFKTVNDTKGHLEGDLCLARVVKAIGETLGQKGALYRWGGDEFAVLLPDFSAEEAYATAERIRRAVERSNPGIDIPVTASIGVSATDRIEIHTADGLLGAADKAMYESKGRGKNCVTVGPVERRAIDQPGPNR